MVFTQFKRTSKLEYFNSCLFNALLQIHKRECGFEKTLAYLQEECLVILRGTLQIELASAWCSHESKNPQFGDTYTISSRHCPFADTQAKTRLRKDTGIFARRMPCHQLGVHTIQKNLQVGDTLNSISSLRFCKHASDNEALGRHVRRSWTSTIRGTLSVLLRETSCWPGQNGINKASKKYAQTQ